MVVTNELFLKNLHSHIDDICLSTFDEGHSLVLSQSPSWN